MKEKIMLNKFVKDRVIENIYYLLSVLKRENCYCDLEKLSLENLLDIKDELLEVLEWEKRKNILNQQK